MFRQHQFSKWNAEITRNSKPSGFPFKQLTYASCFFFFRFSRMSLPTTKMSRHMQLSTAENFQPSTSII